MASTQASAVNVEPATPSTAGGGSCSGDHPESFSQNLPEPSSAATWEGVSSLCKRRAPRIRPSFPTANRRLLGPAYPMMESLWGAVKTKNPRGVLESSSTSTRPSARARSWCAFGKYARASVSFTASETADAFLFGDGAATCSSHAASTTASSRQACTKRPRKRPGRIAFTSRTGSLFLLFPLKRRVYFAGRICTASA